MFLVVVLLLFLSTENVFCTSNTYSAKEEGYQLKVTTPWGDRSYTAPFNFKTTRHYKIAIPVSELKPVGKEDTDKNNTSVNINMEEKDKKPEPEVRKPDALDPMAEKPTSTYDYGDRMVVEVNHLYNLGKYYEASVWVVELIRKRPKYTRAYIMKGSLMWVQGHKDIAKKTWEEALNLEPNNDEVKTLLERFK